MGSCPARSYLSRSAAGTFDVTLRAMAETRKAPARLDADHGNRGGEGGGGASYRWWRRGSVAAWRRGGVVVLCSGGVVQWYGMMHAGNG